jgi:two-component system KDP operon response regulator KdpE
MSDNGRRKKRVLVCDDEPRLLTFVEIKLRLSGYEVIMTTSGETALDLARSANPDIMVLDVVMPGMDGFDVLRELRTFTRLPVIVFSARPGNAGEAMSLGANDFINKPFDPEELVSKIRQLTEPGGNGQSPSGGA